MMRFGKPFGSLGPVDCIEMMHSGKPIAINEFNQLVKFSHKEALTHDDQVKVLSIIKRL